MDEMRFSWISDMLQFLHWKEIYKGGKMMYGEII